MLLCPIPCPRQGAEIYSHVESQVFASARVQVAPTDMPELTLKSKTNLQSLVGSSQLRAILPQPSLPRRVSGGQVGGDFWLSQLERDGMASFQ